MKNIYKSADQDCLDAICWNHYFLKATQQGLINQLRGEVASDASILEMYVANLLQVTDQGATMDYILNQILTANPHLVRYGPVLPAGVEVYLPPADTVFTSN
ncbi:MAG: tail protein X [Bacteroidota bacterium]